VAGAEEVDEADAVVSGIYGVTLKLGADETV